jgi:hypothetical protein
MSHNQGDLGCLMAWDILYLGCLRLGLLRLGLFCSWDVLYLRCFCHWDVLRLGCFKAWNRLFEFGMFCSWDNFVSSSLALGRFLGRFTGVPT